MSLAYWCVFAAALLPYATIGIAKGRDRTRYDNANPRAPNTYRGLALRAHGAHQNGFEVFPIFAVAVLVASSGAPGLSSPGLNALSVGWLALRLAYTAAYLGDRPSLRSILWIIGLLVTVAIFTMPAWHG